MLLRRKTLLLILAVLAALLVLLYLLLRVIMINGYNALEQQGTLRNLTRALNSFQDSADTLGQSIRDWSSWDDTYQFVSDRNDDYIQTNLQDATVLSLGVNLMMFVSASNEIVYTKALELDPTWQNKLLSSFEDYARRDTRFFQVIKGSPTVGYITVDNEPLLIVARPILHSDDSGPEDGTLIWARHIGTAALGDMSQSLRLSLDLRSLLSPTLPDDFLQARDSITPALGRVVIPLDDTTVAGYAQIDDIYGQPTLLLKSSQGRDVYAQAQASLNYFAVALAVAGVIFAVGLLLLLDRLVFAPLARLGQSVRDIGGSNNFSTRLPVAGSDEPAQLAAAINTMLDALAESRDVLYQSNTKLEIGVTQRTLELERQRSQLQAIMDTMGEGLVYCVDGAIAYVNRALVELLDYQVGDLVGQPLGLLFPQQAAERPPSFQKPLRSYQTTFARRDGSALSVAITSTLVNEADGRSVIIVRDITQELASKAQKDYFFARASHDLRSPLSSIMTRLYLLGKRPEQLDAHLKALNSVSNHMLELVNDLLDVSRLEHSELMLKRRDLLLQSVVDQVVELQQADAEVKRVSLCAEMSETPLRVYGDPMRLNQVITNLVSNAIHYTDEGGEVIVRVEEALDEPAWALVRVVDNGIGISEENLAHIFDAFFRVSEERGLGTGLGLYIVKEIVELHGGELSVASELGKGTTFTVRLQLSSDKPA